MTGAVLNNGRQTFAPRAQGSSGVPAASVHLTRTPELASSSVAGEGFVRRAIRLAWSAGRRQTEVTVVGEFRQLGKGMVERAHFPKGGRITCRSGSLWITADGGGEDVVLSSGEFRCFPPGARLLIEAMARSEVLVQA
jgi:hypothetical protein